jgi:GMP synthase-like glutamine amidotransferase
MGGPMSVNDNLPWIEKELHLIRAAVQINMPVLGHCLGGQLIGKALGGEVVSNGVKEIGWLPVEKIDNPQSRHWLASLPQCFEAFHWHGETFSIPRGATNVLSSEHCRHQAFAIDNTLAMQCHIEMTETMVQQWTAHNRQELVEGVETIQSAQAMEYQLTQRIAQLQMIAEPVYERWLQPVMRG